MAEPLSRSVPIVKSTREPWTEGGAEPFKLPRYCQSNSSDYYKCTLLLVYEYSPPGLLLGLIPLIVLTLRCNPFDDDISHSPRDEEEGYDDEGPASSDRDPDRPFCRGDVGQDVD